MKGRTLLTAAVIVTSIVFSSEVVAAQVGMNSNYIGAGISAGVTQGTGNDDDAVFGGNIQGRYAIPQTPISARAAVLFGGDAASIMPLLTYDAPIAEKTNLYLGGGYSFITNEGDTTQLGNRNAPVVTVGAESEVSNDVIVYGDAKWAIDAYENSSGDAVSLQAGLGLRF